ncbi:hypothetical protein [Agromyces kandeliae]|uniref:DUF4175 domain-containing protein n=1 Tax=Agromyces kandeliae TaxID=2666141 RepID=A0A6L5R271_9MICO|nr:hypothetical protein [Agromyces kandeliae]MRX44099.1 hypothetical protein [Agromyces kandeliae]
MSVFPFLIAMALFVFGMWVFSIADVVPGFEAIVFFGGIVCVSLSLAIPFNVLGRRESGV